MIVLSAALVLVALVLLLLGVTGPGLGFVYASIVVSLAAIVFLLLSVLQRRADPEADEAQHDEHEPALDGGGPRPTTSREGGLDVLDEPRLEPDGRPAAEPDLRDAPSASEFEAEPDLRDAPSASEFEAAPPPDPDPGPAPGVGAVRVGVDDGPPRDGEDEEPPLFAWSSGDDEPAAPPPAESGSPPAAQPEDETVAAGAVPARARAPRNRTPTSGSRATRKAPEPYRGPVLVLPERGRFHRPDCRYVRDVEGSVQLTRRQATARRYVPCGVCKP